MDIYIWMLFLAISYQCGGHVGHCQAVSTLKLHNFEDLSAQTVLGVGGQIR